MNIWLIIFSIIFVISLIVLIASVYGVGVESRDKKSAAYQAASVFAVIAAIAFIISSIGLVYFIVKSDQVSGYYNKLGDDDVKKLAQGSIDYIVKNYKEFCKFEKEFPINDAIANKNVLYDYFKTLLNQK